jgi:DNA-binding NarL/FixJ family response regulator
MIFLWERTGNHKTLSFIKLIEITPIRIKLHVKYGIDSTKEAYKNWLSIKQKLVDAKLIDITVTSGPSSLVEHQEELRKLFNKGYSNSQIANNLSLSESTVKRHLKELGLRRREK